jgi:hypothetical protein
MGFVLVFQRNAAIWWREGERGQFEANRKNRIQSETAHFLPPHQCSAVKKSLK